MPCKHTAWLRLVKENDEYAVQVTDRPRRLLGRLTDRSPRNSPELVLMLGNWRKVAALRELAVERRVYSRVDGEVHLLMASLSDQTSRPLLIAETDLVFRNKASRGSASSRCHEVVRRGLSSDAHHTPAVHLTSDESVMNWMINRLMLPFAGVVCVFISDLGGVRSAARHLATWLDDGLPSDSPVLPWLLLVDDGSDSRSSDRILEDFYRCLRGKQVDEQVTPGVDAELLKRFAGIRVVSLDTAADGRAQPQWEEFRTALAHLVEDVQEDRDRHKHLYSGEHLCALMNCTTGLISSAAPTPAPLDFVSVTRSQRPVSQYLESGLSDFLGHIASFELLLSFAVPVIASSIIFDHYMAKMHIFAIEEVFHKLYSPRIAQLGQRLLVAADGTKKLTLPSTFVALLTESLQHQFRDFVGAQSALQHHRDQLSSFQHEWRAIHSSDTCFSCMMRQPKHRLQCGHWICGLCYEHFSDKRGGFQVLSHCPLCRNETDGMRVRIKPKTSTVRILCIDGGGANAGVPLATLKALDAQLGLPFPIQYHFDILYGTSSGAISAWGLALGLSVQDCIVLAETIAKHTFQGRDVSAFPLGWTSAGERLWRCLLTLLTDSKYSSTNLETSLKAVFSEARTLSDWTVANEMGLHVGMPITTADDTATVVVTNDGGAGNPEDTVADFQIFRPSKSVPLWQALRATTAAPFYFKPQVIDGIAYQDGGMTYNNPSALALAAARAQYPEKPHPGLLVSCGTGAGRLTKRGPRSALGLSQPTGGRVQKRKKRTLLRALDRSSVGRVCGAFMRQNDSNREFERVCQHIRGGSLFRFDLEQDGPQPALDDIVDLEGRQTRAEAAAVNRPEIQAAARCILAQRFYFELDRMPHYDNGMYQCSGAIYCDLEPGSPEQAALLHHRDQAAAVFRLGSQTLPGPFLRRATRQSDGALVKDVAFSVRTGQTEFSIEIQEGADKFAGISGSPFTIDRLVQLQGLDDWFGGGYE